MLIYFAHVMKATDSFGDWWVLNVCSFGCFGCHEVALSLCCHLKHITAAAENDRKYTSDPSHPDKTVSPHGNHTTCSSALASNFRSKIKSAAEIQSVLMTPEHLQEAKLTPWPVGITRCLVHTPSIHPSTTLSSMPFGTFSLIIIDCIFC